MIAFYLQFYLKIGLLLSVFNLLATMVAGATYRQALYAEARKSKLFRLPWLLLPVAIIVAWPVNLSYTLTVVVGLLPKKSWQELVDEYESNH